MEEAAARRGGEQPGATEAGAHERALRVIGHWIDSQKPKDVFLFEQDGAYVVRLLEVGQAGAHHTISEFTREDIDTLIEQGPDLRDQAEARVDRRAAARGRRGATRGRTGRPPPRPIRRRRPAGASPPADRPAVAVTGPMTNAGVTSAGGAGTINVLTVAFEGGPTR